MVDFIEASLIDNQVGILYIFHDDHQSLPPFVPSYPINETVIDLSRNCRNAGKVYELMRFFNPIAPPPETELKVKASTNPSI